MSFLKNLGERATSTAKKVGEKSSELVETGKLKMQISQIEGDIKIVKSEIGEVVYNSYANGLDLPSEEILVLCAGIKEKYAEIEALKAKAEEVQND